MIPTRESKVQSRALKQRERQVSSQEAEHKQMIPFQAFLPQSSEALHTIFGKRYCSNSKAKNK